MADDHVFESEEWRQVPGHPAYEASSLGRVRSIDRIEVNSLGRQRFLQGHILQRNPNRRYHTVSLKKGLKQTMAHVIVCETFHGPRPSKNHEVAHCNGDSHDNRVNNLRWATRKENAEDAIRHGTKARGKTNGGAKLTDTEILAMRKMRADANATQQHIADEFGISPTQTRRIIRRDNWKHLP